MQAAARKILYLKPPLKVRFVWKHYRHNNRKLDREGEREMTTFSNPAYSVILVLQLTHLVSDLLFNSSTIIIGTKNPILLLVIFLLQDMGLILAAVLIFLIFFNTYAFKAGLLSILVRKFSATLVVSFLYFALTLSYHAWSLDLQWRRPNSYIWSEGLLALYVLQKLLAVVYYYLYKRAALRLGDSKYYEDSTWLRKHLNMR